MSICIPPKRKNHASAWVFLFGGNGGALNPCRARLGIASRSPLPLVATDPLPLSYLRLERVSLTNTFHQKEKPVLCTGFSFWWKPQSKLCRGSEPPPRLQRAEQAALRSRWSLQILCLFLVCGLNAAFRPDQFYQIKNRCKSIGFLFGGNGGARTRDLTDVNRAL